VFEQNSQIKAVRQYWRRYLATDHRVQKKVTTTWWLAPLLRQMHEPSLVYADRIAVKDGQVFTAEASSAHTDLMLHLIEEHLGKQLSELVANVLLLDNRTTKAQYAMASVLANIDPLVETTLPNRPALRGIAETLFITERTMARRIVAATDKTPTKLRSKIAS
jgi:transcriptional regulator GlxA family with amidase domain